MRPARLLVCVLLVLHKLQWVTGARGGRGRGKGKGKQLLPFGNAAEYSLVSKKPVDPDTAHIVKGSYYAQTYKLGYKVLLICVSEGNPRPNIKWYKDGSEVLDKLSTHFYEKPLTEKRIWAKIEIDPATMGDQGIYTCMANNNKGLMTKNFKVEFVYS